MAMYASATELASLLQKDLDTATAELVLTMASGLLAGEAGTAWASTSATWSTTYANGCTELELPFSPVIAVSAVRVNGAVTIGWVLRGNSIYRTAGFGYRYAWPPDQVEVDLTYGFTAVPDDVKAATLDIAAQAYDVPVAAVVSESIDDYAVRYATTGGGLQMTGMANGVAASYRGVLIA